MAAAANLRQSFGYPAGVFVLSLDGLWPGCRGLVRREGAVGPAFATGAVWICCCTTGFGVCFADFTLPSTFVAAWVFGFAGSASDAEWCVVGGGVTGRTTLGCDVVGSGPAAAACGVGPEWSGWGTPSVRAIDSVMCCSGAGSAPAALNPQLASVAHTAAKTNATRRGRGILARVFAKRGVASNCCSNAIMLTWFSITSSRGNTRSSVRNASSAGAAAARAGRRRIRRATGRGRSSDGLPGDAIRERGQRPPVGGLHRSGFLAENVCGVCDREIGNVAQQHDGALVGRQRFERSHGRRCTDSIEHLVVAVVGGGLVLRVERDVA